MLVMLVKYFQLGQEKHLCSSGSGSFVCATTLAGTSQHQFLGAMGFGGAAVEGYDAIRVLLGPGFGTYREVNP